MVSVGHKYRPTNIPSCTQDSECGTTVEGSAVCAYNPTTGQGQCRQARTCREIGGSWNASGSSAHGLEVDVGAMGIEIIGGSTQNLPICFNSDGRAMNIWGNGPPGNSTHSCGDEAVFVVGVASMTQGQIPSAHNALKCNCGRSGAGPDIDCQIERENLGLVRIEVSPRGAVTVL